MADDTVQRYEELVRYLVKPLLGTDEFKVSGAVRGNQIQLQLEAPENLRGRVIGRGGRVARSIRTLLEAAAIDSDLQPTFDIVD